VISSKRAIRNPLFFNAANHRDGASAHSLCTQAGHCTKQVQKDRPINRRRYSGIEMNEKFLGELSARLAAMAASNPAKDLEKNFRGMLSSAFTRMDLVSREEYDVQVQVLARAREKLAALEARLAEIEARASSPKP
jgi:hypothetical protein